MNHSATDATKPTAPLSHPVATPDGESAKQPPLPEPPYEPYANKPPSAGPRYEPYKDI